AALRGRSALGADSFGYLDDRRPRPVGKAVEDTGSKQPLASGLGLVARSELDQDEDFRWVGDAPQDAMPFCGSPRAGSIFVEQGLPRVVVADVDARQDESHPRPLSRVSDGR